jgi:hypothetical protein
MLATTKRPRELETLHRGDVLCDRHRREYYVVTDVDADAVSLREHEKEFVVPHSFFCPMYGHRLFNVERSRSLEAPAWCERCRRQL